LSRSRAVLIGTSTYSELPDIPAAANSLDRMQRLLTGPLCLWPASKVTVVPEQRLPGDLPDRLIDLYKKAADVALFYYVGHGHMDDESQLCLGLVDSRHRETDRRAATSLTFDAVRRAVRASPAAMKVVILDCCFAGLAVHGPRAVDVHALTGGTGAYTLAATGPYTLAWFESDRDAPAPHTYFTKHFAEIVERGIPGGETGLTLDAIFRRLCDDLKRAGKPSPTCRSIDAAAAFLFARNAAADVAPDVQPEQKPDPVQAKRARATRILSEALRVAQSITDDDLKAGALAIIAKAVAATDPDRAARLITDAERIAQPITRRTPKERALAAIAWAAAATDPDRAERIAQSITDKDSKASALVMVAEAVADTDPDRAERIARSITDEHSRASALGYIT
jgi:hypothetical protein